MSLNAIAEEVGRYRAIAEIAETLPQYFNYDFAQLQAKLIEIKNTSLPF